MTSRNVGPHPDEAASLEKHKYRAKPGTDEPKDNDVWSK